MNKRLSKMPLNIINTLFHNPHITSSNFLMHFEWNIAIFFNNTRFLFLGQPVNWTVPLLSSTGGSYVGDPSKSCVVMDGATQDVLESLCMSSMMPLKTVCDFY